MKHALQPSLSDVKVTFEFLPPMGDSTSVLQIPKVLPKIYEGEKLVVYGIVKSNEVTGPVKGEVTLRGQIVTSEEELKISHTVAFNERPTDHNASTIHHLAAKTCIMELERDKQPKEDIIKLSIESSVISSETAFIAVDEDSSTPINEPLKVYHMSSLHTDIQDLMVVCNSSIDNMLCRGEALDSLQEQSEALNSSAKMFYSAKKKSGGGILSGIGSALSSIASSFSWNSSKNSSTPAANRLASDNSSNMSSASYEDSLKEELDELENEDIPTSTLSSSVAKATPAPPKAADNLSSIILLQQANGSWVLNETLATHLQSSLTDLKDGCPSDCPSSDVWATVLVIKVLRLRYSAQSDEWELVVKKAETWLKGQARDKFDTLFAAAEKVIG